MAATPSAGQIRGIVDGCVDGQKRSLRAQGLSYEGNEELVRQYCYCMAATVADASSTPEGRAKIMDGDAVVRSRLQKADAICVDGVQNGRKFAPEK